MTFAIPSKGRPGSCGATLRELNAGDQAVLFVPEVEVAEYERANVGTRVVGVPVEIRGITATRNWILKSVKDRWVVMVDDDVMMAGFTELYDERAKMRTGGAVDWVAESVRLFEVTEGLGWKIWGVATQGALRSIYPYRPFIWRTYVTASFMGIVNDGSYLFDETFPVKEDYEICLRHIEQFGGVVGARYLWWQNEHWGTDGGCRDYRTQEIEEVAIRRLIEKYPGSIRRVERGGSRYSIELEF